MKNKYILLEMNQRNEIRADVNMTIKNMELTEIENMNVKIDTGCPLHIYTNFKVWYIEYKGTANEAKGLW